MSEEEDVALDREAARTAVRRAIRRAAGHYRRGMRAGFGSNERKRQMAEFDIRIRSAFMVARGAGVDEQAFIELAREAVPDLANRVILPGVTASPPPGPLERAPEFDTS